MEIPLGSVAMLDLSGVYEQDQLLGDVRNIIRGSEGSWGNMAGRASLTLPVGGLLTRHTMFGSSMVMMPCWSTSDSSAQMLISQGTVVASSAPTFAHFLALKTGTITVTVTSEGKSGNATVVIQ